MATHIQSGGRYPVLRSLAILYVIGALVALVGGVAGAVYLFGWAPLNVGDRVALGLSALAVTFFAVITLCGVAEVFKLIMDVEHNTRLTAEATNRAATAVSSTDDEPAEMALMRGH